MEFMYLIIRTDDQDLLNEMERYAIDNGMTGGDEEDKYYSASTIAENMDFILLVDVEDDE